MSYERGNVARMAGYVYGEQPAGSDIVKLNTNENPYPPSPTVAEALARFDVATLRRYPPATADDLRGVLAGRLGIEPGNVVATNGGDEGLRLAITTFVDPHATLGLAEPSYSLYPVLAAVQDCTVTKVPLDAEWRPPGDLARRLNAAGARLTCLVNPHAPSGVLLDGETIARIANELDGVLLVDEAYVDFADPEREHDLAPLIRRHDNLLLLRTLSKGYSLAGLRVGFLIGDVGLIQPIRVKTRDSFNVGTLAQSVAIAALSDPDHAKRSWRAIRDERARLADALRALGWFVPESQANFVLARKPGAADVYRSLRERGIFVRYFDRPRLADCLRITVGRDDENDKLLDAIVAIAADQRCDG
ncbi:MAG: histidinol-phosphate transaminase [Gammaproteobacteria bacterium]|nr:histidinol-phosphate transaminase [Gammaproteobacteria bacterium]